MRFKPRDPHGFTLVEVMVSVALFAVLSVGLMQAFAKHAKHVIQAQNDSHLSEELQLFSDALEAYLGNTTQFIACNCGNGCVYSDANAPDCTGNPGTCSNLPGGSNILVRFEYEDAANPARVPNGDPNCLLGGLAGNTLSAGVSPDQLIPRGCKRRMDLVYTPPVPAGGSQAQPGTLALEWENLTTGAPDAPPHVAVQVTGVYAVQCGQIPLNPGAANPSPSPDQFRLRFRAKARSTNYPYLTTDPAYEGWFPTEQNFWLGTHRSIVTDVNFRNLDVQGVHFGKALSYQGCVPNGKSDSSGNCCSGYMDAAGVCQDASQCLTRGQAATIFSICCSHKVAGGNCL